MNTALWIAQGLLAVVFLAAGSAKLLQSREELHDKTPYVEDFTDGQIRAIGVIEVLGALGLVLPAVIGIAPILVPIAATGLVVTMVGAAIVHVRRSELPMVIPNVVLGLLAAFVAWGRFGPHAF